MRKFRELNYQKIKYGRKKKPIFYRCFLQSVEPQGRGEVRGIKGWRSRATPSSSCRLLNWFCYKVVSHQRSARKTPPNRGLLAAKTWRIPSQGIPAQSRSPEVLTFAFRLITAVIQDTSFHPTTLFHQRPNPAAPRAHSVSFTLPVHCCKYISPTNNFINTQKLVRMTTLQSPRSFKHTDSSNSCQALHRSWGRV